VLRLSQIPSDSPDPTLKAEGRLMGEWANLLEAECAGLTAGGQSLNLDVGGLVDVDARGLQVLRRLQRGSVNLIGCTPILLAQLAQEKLP